MIKKYLPAFCTLWLVGCAALSQQHNEHAALYQNLKSPADSSKQAQKFPIDDKVNLMLNLQEGARLYQLAGEYQQSQNYLKTLLDIYKEREYEAVFTLEDSAQIASAVSNDKVIPYKGSDYERIFARQLQAINYLNLGKVNDALIEMRAAANDQRFAANARSKKVDRAEQKRKEKYQAYAKQDQIAFLQSLVGDERNGFQSSYMFYFSALLREATGDVNGSFIDYRKAWEIQATNLYAAQNVVNLARIYDRSNAARYQRLSGRKPIRLPKTHGRLALVIERGFVQPRGEFTFEVQYDYLDGNSNPHFTWGKVAVPTYEHKFDLLTPIIVQAAGKTATSQYLFSTLPMAAYQLKEAMPGILLRQTVRLASKQALSQAAGAAASDSDSSLNVGILAEIVVSGALNYFEQADTRSWIGLPHQVDNLEMILPAGTHRLEIALGGGRVGAIEVDIRAGKLTLARLVDTGTFSIGNQLYPTRR